MLANGSTMAKNTARVSTADASFRLPRKRADVRSNGRWNTAARTTARNSGARNGQMTSRSKAVATTTRIANVTLAPRDCARADGDWRGSGSRGLAETRSSTTLSYPRSGPRAARKTARGPGSAARDAEYRGDDHLDSRSRFAEGGL